MKTQPKPFAEITAQYTEQRVPGYQGNLLIEALPPLMDDKQVFQQLLRLPKFTEEQRTWPTHERQLLLMGLFHILIPSTQHLQLARMLDAMIRDGYAGRPLVSAQSNALLNRIYRAQTDGTLCNSAQPTPFRTTATTKALLGFSGSGKTSAIARILATYPPVIFHPDSCSFQIPSLSIEAPHDGSSVKGLCHAILRKVDELVPGANYYDIYAAKGRPSHEVLLGHVARVLHIHRVGLLVCDEIQNLENAPKNKQSLMTLLVSASNEFGVPILFVGTNKARRLLSLDFRQARRSSNVGPTCWNKLERDSSEWRRFVQILWNYQWVKKPTALSPSTMDLLYEYSQGITDILIKLFVIAQWRAMQSGAEELSDSLIHSVALNELQMVRPMLDALKNNDLRVLELYDDIAPLNFEELTRSTTFEIERPPEIRTKQSEFRAEPEQPPETTESKATEADSLAPQTLPLPAEVKQKVVAIRPAKRTRPEAGSTTAPAAHVEAMKTPTSVELCSVLGIR